jgi:hypothetical protein
MEETYKFCQSGGMPLDKGSGTNADGSKSTMYCNLCYKDGRFANPEIKMGTEMQAFVIERLKEKGFLAPIAWLFTRSIPSLVRWNTKTGASHDE